MVRIRSTLALAAALAALGAASLAGAFGSTPGRERDRVWGEQELAVLASLRLSELPVAAADPSNAVQASTAAAALGKKLFFDARFSRNQAVACASCHDPAKQFQDGKPVGEGLGMGSRRSMPVVGAGHSPWLFWDGRKDSLWSQALGPLEDPLEHGGNRLRYARLLRTHYREDYSALFGSLPDLDNLPTDASPAGTIEEQTAWAHMTPAQRNAVSRVFANMGKAIAAYEHTLQYEPSRLDRYIETVLSGNERSSVTVTAQEVRGLRLFIGKGQCVSCHNGPLLTDQQFHNTGVPERSVHRIDHGRADAVAKLRSDEFNCLGPYSDARPEQCQELRFLAEDSLFEGAFRTPGLRGVATRPPYMHAGQFVSLEEVVRHYVEAPRSTVGRSELSPSRHPAVGEARMKHRLPIRLSSAEQQDLVAFLRTLSP